MAGIGSFFGREGIVRLLWWNRTRKGLEAGPAALPFPSWEVQVLLTQFQGLGESAGDAISSNCVAYEWGGGVVLLVLVLSLCYLGLLCYYGITRKHAVWKHCTIKEAIVNMKDTFNESKGKSCIARTLAIKEAWNVLLFRGEWEQEDHPDKTDIIHTSFVDRSAPGPPSQSFVCKCLQLPSVRARPEGLSLTHTAGGAAGTGRCSTGCTRARGGTASGACSAACSSVPAHSLPPSSLPLSSSDSLLPPSSVPPPTQSFLPPAFLLRLPPSFPRRLSPFPATRAPL